MLVEHPDENRGDPDLTLMQTSALERFHALRVAVDQLHGIVISPRLADKYARAESIVAEINASAPNFSPFNVGNLNRLTQHAS